ncbi:5'-nucleotidase C-terminal domain-containing protein [Microbacterium sp. B2969]|uniref:5'-nucleotidase C-terminal domain-containing protein n=1 Tax=Microbacterium alkaliflavum TaxID=3248839 RepID=A0ABW7QE99_9MICO
MRTRSTVPPALRRRVALTVVSVAALATAALVDSDRAQAGTAPAADFGVSSCGVPDTVPEPIAPPAAAAQVDAQAVQTSGRITADFNRGRHPTPSTPGGLSVSPGAESTMTNFIADVQLWEARRDTPGTRIALVYAASVGADLTYAASGPDDPAGNLTADEILAVHRDVRSLCTVQLTGRDLHAVLEEQWGPLSANLSFAKLATSKDLTYVTDYTAPVGSRITHVFFKGRAVAPDEVFTVAMEDLLASGSYGFPTLRDATGRGNLGGTNLSALFNWFRVSTIASPDYAQRSIGVTVVPRAPGGVVSGAPIRVDLSSLEFTTNEPRATEARITFGANTDQWSRTIDPSLVRNTDEAGRASVFPTVHGSGVVPMHITTYTGTAFTVPLTIEEGSFERAPTTTWATPSTLHAKEGTPVTLTVQVGSPGPTGVIGEVSIYDGGKAKSIAWSPLPADGSGRVTVTLPQLSKGLHLIWVKYLGSQLQEPSQSKRVPVVVW